MNRTLIFSVFGFSIRLTKGQTVSMLITRRRRVVFASCPKVKA